MRTWLVLVCVSVTAALTARTALPQQDETREQIVSYVVQSTGPVSLTIPVQAATKAAWVRAAGGNWQPLAAKVRDGAVELRLEAEHLHSGATILVLDPPPWLNLDDSEPPGVLRFEVDGQEMQGPAEVSLGWVEEAPKQILLEVEDALNPLDLGSICVTFGGQVYRPGETGVRFAAEGQKRGAVKVNVRALLRATETEAGSMTLTIDDYALDYERLVRSVSWQIVPSTELDDGTILSVESVTDASGWQDWSVVSDAEVMEQGDPTTAGVTWLSQQHPREHWIKWKFPEPRKVNGVDLWWAYYQCYRTSVAYQVQTWDGERWVTQVAVKGQAETQHSSHQFDAVETTAVRVFQPPMSGHPGRADYMWLAEATVSCE